jgi:hypothetical protein
MLAQVPMVHAALLHGQCVKATRLGSRHIIIIIIIIIKLPN